MSKTLLDLIENNKDFNAAVQPQLLRLESNITLLEEGENHRQLYVIKKGGVRVTSHSEIDEGHEIKPGLSDLGPGTLVGEFCLFDAEPASATVQTIIESELVEIDGDRLQVFLKANPEIGYKVLWEIMVELVSRIRHSNKAVVRLLAWGLKAHKLDKYL